MARGRLNDKEKELVDGLEKTGIQKNTARALVFVASRGEAKAREIEDSTYLRQPEVSLAMQELRELGWAAKKDVKEKRKKGRPHHSYFLNKSIEEIIDEIREKEEKRMDEIRDNLKRIKELSDSVF